MIFEIVAALAIFFIGIPLAFMVLAGFLRLLFSPAGLLIIGVICVVWVIADSQPKHVGSSFSAYDQRVSR